MSRIEQVTCPDCRGDGMESSVEAAIYYADRGEIEPCPRCEGTGSIPKENSDG